MIVYDPESDFGNQVIEYTDMKELPASIKLGIEELTACLPITKESVATINEIITELCRQCEEHGYIRGLKRAQTIHDELQEVV